MEIGLIITAIFSFGVILLVWGLRPTSWARKASTQEGRLPGTRVGEDAVASTLKLILAESGDLVTATIEEDHRAAAQRR
jgi:hypothetical protein